MRRRRPAARERGAALLLALVVLVLATTAGLLIATAVTLEHRRQREEVLRTRLTVLSDSALVEALAELRIAPWSTGVALHPFDGGEIGSQIRSLDDSHRRVLARARIEELERTVEADVALGPGGPRVVAWRPKGTGPAAD